VIEHRKIETSPSTRTGSHAARTLPLAPLAGIAGRGLNRLPNVPTQFVIPVAVGNLASARRTAWRVVFSLSPFAQLIAIVALLAMEAAR
jgi:hypothetical protein